MYLFFFLYPFRILTFINWIASVKVSLLTANFSCISCCALWLFDARKEIIRRVNTNHIPCSMYRSKSVHPLYSTIIQRGECEYGAKKEHLFHIAPPGSHISMNLLHFAALFRLYALAAYPSPFFNSFLLLHFTSSPLLRPDWMNGRVE